MIRVTVWSKLRVNQIGLTAFLYSTVIIDESNEKEKKKKNEKNR